MNALNKREKLLNLRLSKLLTVTSACAWQFILGSGLLLTGCGSQRPVDTLATPPTSPTPTPTASDPIPFASPLTRSSSASPQATTDLNRKLSKALTDQVGLPVEVNCPEQNGTSANTRLNCPAVAEGQRFTVAVELTGNADPFKWNTQGLLRLDRLEEFIQTSIQQKSGTKVTADCGGRLRVATAGETFDCKVSDAEGQARTVQVTVKDAIGNVDVTLLSAQAENGPSPQASP